MGHFLFDKYEIYLDKRHGSFSCKTILTVFPSNVIGQNEIVKMQEERSEPCQIRDFSGAIALIQYMITQSKDSGQKRMSPKRMDAGHLISQDGSPLSFNDHAATNNHCHATPTSPREVY